MRYDHFHTEVLLSINIKKWEEVEGGWTGYPDKWEDMNFLQKEFALIHIVAAWMEMSGDVSIVKLGRFRLAG